jgi:hypothetical protein
LHDHDDDAMSEGMMMMRRGTKTRDEFMEEENHGDSDLTVMMSERFTDGSMVMKNSIGAGTVYMWVHGAGYQQAGAGRMLWIMHNARPTDGRQAYLHLYIQVTNNLNMNTKVQITTSFLRASTSFCHLCFVLDRYFLLFRVRQKRRRCDVASRHSRLPFLSSAAFH